MYASFVGSKLFSDFLGEVRTILNGIPEGKVTDDIRESNRLVKVSVLRCKRYSLAAGLLGV